MLSEAVTDAADNIAAQGAVGGFAILFIAAIVALWRRDQARNAAELERIAKAHGEELDRIEGAHGREIDRLEFARTREAARADASEKARAELDREVRTETTRIMQTTADRLEETALVLRDVRRQP